MATHWEKQEVLHKWKVSDRTFPVGVRALIFWEILWDVVSVPCTYRSLFSLPHPLPHPTSGLWESIKHLFLRDAFPDQQSKSVLKIIWATYVLCTFLYYFTHCTVFQWLHCMFDSARWQKSPQEQGKCCVSPYLQFLAQCLAPSGSLILLI